VCAAPVATAWLIAERAVRAVRATAPRNLGRMAGGP